METPPLILLLLLGILASSLAARCRVVLVLLMTGLVVRLAVADAPPETAAGFLLVPLAPRGPLLGTD